MYIIPLKLSFIQTPIYPIQLPLAFLISSIVLPFKPLSIAPKFNSEPLLLVFHSRTHILGPVIMDVSPLSFCLSIHSVSFINVPINVYHPPSPMCGIVFPIPFINRSVFPKLNTFSAPVVLLVSLPNVNAYSVNFQRNLAL